MFIEALILGVIIGLARHGKIFRLSYANFNVPQLVYASALLYIGIIIMNLGLIDYNTSLYTAFLLISYILIVIFLIANLDKKYMFIPLAGLCSNLLCFIINGFKFPLSSEAVLKYYGAEMIELLKSGKIKFFTPAENASLSFLGNVIPVNKILSITILSIGDIIISIGIVLVVQAIISDKHIQNRNRITFSKNIFR